MNANRCLHLRSDVQNAGSALNENDRAVSQSVAYNDEQCPSFRPPRLISMQTSSRIGSLPRYPLRSPSVSSFNESPKCIKRGGQSGPRLKFGGNEATNLLKALHFILPSLSLSLLLSPRNTTHPTHSDGRTHGRSPKGLARIPTTFVTHSAAQHRMTSRPAGGRDGLAVID